MKPKVQLLPDNPFEAIYSLKEQLLEKYVAICPKSLYHYTSPQACFAILAPPRHRLWATSIVRQNDTSEMEYSSRLIARVALKVFPKTGKLLLLNKTTREDLPSNMTVVSFCSRADLLSQWRAYGTNGGGCAIGFNAKKLASGAPRGYMLRPVVYQPKSQKALIEEVLLQTEQIGKRFACPNPEAFAIVCAQILAPWLKHPSFAEEQEWRLVGEARRLKFRAGSAGVIPYSEISFDKSCVEELWLGPVSDVRMNRESWDLFLGRRFGRTKAGASVVAVKTSAIPLRRLDAN
jgi:hypothetical protein